MTFYHFFLISLICLSVLLSLITAIEETECKEFWVSHYEYNKFHDLSLIKGAQSEDYFAKIAVTFTSDHGDVHVVFSESTETTDTNRVYEFLLGGYDNTLFEIRRKDCLHEKRNFNGNRFADYHVPTDREFNVEFSISKSGVVQLESEEQFKFNLTDQLPVIPVKYISFAGYRGASSKVTFDCVRTSTLSASESATEQLTENMSTTTTAEQGAGDTPEPMSDSSIDNDDDRINAIKEDPTTLSSSIKPAAKSGLF